MTDALQAVVRRHRDPPDPRAHVMPIALKPLRLAATGLLALVALGLAGTGQVAAADPTPAPRPTERPVAVIPAAKITHKPPANLNLYDADGFRYQDPYYSACVSAAGMDMLNFVSLAGAGGRDFTWQRTRSDTAVQSMLTWARAHDTLDGGTGSDPHGWRNVLNYYGWGSDALLEGQRVYDDAAYKTYAGAVKAAVRAMILTEKPVGMLGWAGRHAQMITGYYGLKGDPFARDSSGTWTNTFTVDGFYLADPLKSDGFVNAKITYTRLRDSTNPELRFRPYTETDSLLDDRYTAGSVVSKNEWYGKYVLVIPRR
jgi:hypothetical protein